MVVCWGVEWTHLTLVHPRLTNKVDKPKETLQTIVRLFCIEFSLVSHLIPFKNKTPMVYVSRQRSLDVSLSELLSWYLMFLKFQWRLLVVFVNRAHQRFLIVSEWRFSEVSPPVGNSTFPSVQTSGLLSQYWLSKCCLIAEWAIHEGQFEWQSSSYGVQTF